MTEYVAYLDEAGDLGAHRGTKWFVLSAVVIRKTDETLRRSRIKAIQTRLNVKVIHFREIKDFSKKAYVVSQILDLPFVYMNVIMDTNQYDSNRIPNTETVYNYLCKYLLQRVSGYMNKVAGSTDIVLSARGTSRDKELIEYITEKLLPYQYNHIDQSSFQKVQAKSASQWDLLQLADICATSLFYQYEVNSWGFCMPCFAKPLRSHLYSKNGRIDSYGIKFFQDSMKTDDLLQCQNCICTKKKESPARLPHDEHAG